MKGGEVRRRKWCYSQKPTVYCIQCDLCNGSNITWSEFEHKIWCYDCKKDTSGTGGIFDGPIPVGLCKIMGIRFDRINIKTKKISRWVDGKYRRIKKDEVVR